MKGPAVGELLGDGDHALTRELQLVLQTILVLLGLVELLPSSKGKQLKTKQKTVTWRKTFHVEPLQSKLLPGEAPFT